MQRAWQLSCARQTPNANALHLQQLREFCDRNQNIISTRKPLALTLPKLRLSRDRGWHRYFQESGIGRLELVYIPLLLRTATAKFGPRAELCLLQLLNPATPVTPDLNHSPPTEN